MKTNFAICSMPHHISFDGIPIQRLQELAQAEKDGRLVVYPSAAKEGDPPPECFYNDNGGIWCLGLSCCEMDEPIDRCKSCWYCESGDFADNCEAAEAALEGKNNGRTN